MARQSLLIPTVEFFASDLAVGKLLHKVLEINVIYLICIAERSFSLYGRTDNPR
jgi:hypothetical protein